MKVGSLSVTCVVAAVTFFLPTELFAQTDTVYVRSTRKVSLSLGKDKRELAYGVAALAIGKKDRTIAIAQDEVLAVDLPQGKNVLIDVTATPYKKYDVRPSRDTEAISRDELHRFLKAQDMRSTTLAFAYLETYKDGFFRDDALLLINVLNAESQLTQLDAAVQKENMYLAGDLALGLTSNAGASLLSAPQQRKKESLLQSVSEFFDRAADLAMESRQYEKSLELYNKANYLVRDEARATKVLTAKRLGDETRYNQLIKDADSLERIHALPETIRTLKKALDLRSSEEVNSRVARLDMLVQDSLYASAVRQDQNEDFIFYRKKGYYNYLNSYPNGKYVKPSEERIVKLNKEIVKVNKIALFYGWSSVSFQDATFMGESSAGMTVVGLGRLTETRFFGVDFAFNQDFFTISKLQDYGEIDLAGLDRIILTKDSNGKQGYAGAFQGTASFGVLSYKKGLLKVYGGGSVGWGQLRTWVYGYRYNIVNDKLPYNTTGKTPHHYVMRPGDLNTDVLNASFLLLVNYSKFLMKASASINQPFVASVSVGLAL